MRILAIDTALVNCAVAVWDSDGVGVPPVLFCETIGRGHAERLTGMLGEAMAEASCAFSDLDRIAVTTGPGSFTGMRVGLSVARGFGLVLGKPVVGITTLAAMAKPFLGEVQTHPVFVSMEGKGEEIYCQLFGAEGVPRSPAEVRRLSELSETLPPETRFVGASSRRVVEAVGASTDRILSEAACPDVADVARLGVLADPKQARPVPLYLRPPDAAPQKKGKIARL
ncbi:tRNA (adenosine(37)-N6)-threonylcarbamoyltransferase complex dimerization subunit type 1 TsaB [Roseibium sp. CAU 1637]|uniref:tRNA (Adenosine(37)-N6)-threonylcarbamoyltransferase complex dimerization subunit type 1 TsaB n=1 Tax=Roseibium limicola TaxID=2816037 RepID=A0A939J9Y9_9HYPH|nr:tRNA (adenosine(37)-N6)-threonylcarbamoyltransferase complex dimerization subunit type 1 TsaB [Roseibium limicola]MBO0346404.1 tRNA (adenosine(37)-N6)-threonylcarbamoyltransferase complex dimerization subunit type 1 TsaB [Roseibium limicola]